MKTGLALAMPAMVNWTAQNRSFLNLAAMIAVEMAFGESELQLFFQRLVLN